MLRRGLPVFLSAVAASLFAGGCGGDGHQDMMMEGPSGVSPAPASASLMAVSPSGGSIGIPTTTPITIRFGAGMATGMEQYLDLHLGDLGGPTLPLHCSWSGDWRVLTCTPDAPLQSQTMYWVHLGGGMMTRAGQLLDYDHYGPMMGGQWIMGAMMGGRLHGGRPWGMMHGYWQNPNGGYGMAFAFTTA